MKEEAEYILQRAEKMILRERNRESKAQAERQEKKGGGLGLMLTGDDW